MQATEPMKSFEDLADTMYQPEESNDEVTDAPDPEADQPEVAETEDDEAPQDDVEAEADEAEADADDDDEEAEVEAVPEQPEPITVKVDGEDVTVTLEELKQSFSGQAYIKKGMNDAAAMRKQVEVEFQTVQQQQQQLQQLVDVAQQGGFVAPTPPDIAMLDADPIGYMQAKAEFETRDAEYKNNLQQYQYHQQQIAEQQERARIAYRDEQREKLLAAIPDLADPVKGTQIQAQIAEVATKHYGFTMDQLKAITDVRPALVLYDAAKYHELLKNTKKAALKAEKARPVAKAGAKPDQKRSNQRKKLERLKATGSDEAALSLMFQD